MESVSLGYDVFTGLLNELSLSFLIYKMCFMKYILKFFHTSKSRTQSWSARTHFFLFCDPINNNVKSVIFVCLYDIQMNK